MNSIPIDWLEAQLAKANHNLEQARQKFEDAQRRLEETQKQVDRYSEVLNDAKEALEKDARVKTGVKPAMNMPDHIAKILKEHGPLHASEIYEFLKEEGRNTTTVNSITTQLNRYKLERFNKNEEGKWFLVSNGLLEYRPFGPSND